MGDVFEAMFQTVAVGLVLLDEGGEPLQLNDFCRELLGDDAEAVVRDGVTAVLAEAATAEGPVDVAVGFGKVAFLTRLPDTGGAGEGTARYVLATGLAFGFRDVVTGLENQDAALSRLHHLLARRTPVNVELVFLDLDGFKEVNDTLGHQVGDEVLRAVAERLVATVRPEDVVVRWGGDEFVVILEDGAEGSAPHVCKRISEAMEEPLTTSAGPVTMSASCGCAAGSNGDDPAELLHSADLRMYAAKRARTA